MGGCCDPRVPRVYQLKINGVSVGLTGVEQAFVEVSQMALATDEAMAEEILKRVKSRNYIPDSAAIRYKAALLAEYKKYLAAFGQANPAVNAAGKYTGENTVEKSKGGDMMEIKVLGPGCPKCHALEKNVREAVSELGINANVIKVTDIKEITNAGVLITPGLIVNGKLKISGKVPNKNDIKKYLQEELQG